MAEDKALPSLSTAQIAELAKEAGVSFDQIRQIVKMVGPNRSSILFHARAIANDRKR